MKMKLEQEHNLNLLEFLDIYDVDMNLYLAAQQSQSNPFHINRQTVIYENVFDDNEDLKLKLNSLLTEIVLHSNQFFFNQNIQNVYNFHNETYSLFAQHGLKIAVSKNKNILLDMSFYDLNRKQLNGVKLEERDCNGVPIYHPFFVVFKLSEAEIESKAKLQVITYYSNNYDTPFYNPDYNRDMYNVEEYRNAEIIKQLLSVAI